MNPDALTIADALDKERKAKGPRGPMHGIPVLIKDNIDTADRMATTAGSRAMIGAKPPKDAFIVQRLRDAGAVILGKTNLSEWANIRSSHSTSGWSGRGGLTRNPYALDRNPCGSSSGSGAAVSANLCAVAIGTETDGSIVCPSSANGIVGIKPTVGLASRSGIIPISHSQDTPGPMARTVKDAAILLGVLAGVDLEDAATSASRGKLQSDYTQFLDPNGLNGTRLGIVRKFFGFSENVDDLMNTVIDQMKRAGATIVDPVDLPSFGKFDDTELLVLEYELKADLNAYLARLGPGAPVRTLKDVIDFNDRHHEEELKYFGQDIFLKAQEKGPLTETEYIDALAKNHQLSRAEGIDAVMDRLQLDALGRADRLARMGHRPRKRRSFHRRQLELCRRRRLSEHQRAGWNALRTSGRDLVFRTRLERANAHQDRIGIRADDQSTYASALSGDARFEGLRSYRLKNLYSHSRLFLKRETRNDCYSACFENVCMPHSSFAPPQRPDRGSAPASGIFVQGSHPMLR